MKTETVYMLIAAGAASAAAGLAPYSHDGMMAASITVMSVGATWFCLYGAYLEEQRTEDLPPVGGRDS